MCTQGMVISVLIAGLIAFTAQSEAIAVAEMIPNPQVSGVSGVDSDAPLRERLCIQPIPHEIRGNLGPNTPDNRAYLDSARPDPVWNLPSGELKMPNIFVLMRIPLDRSATRLLTPNLDSPVQNEETSPALDLAGDSLHSRLAYPLPKGLC